MAFAESVVEIQYLLGKSVRSYPHIVLEVALA